MGFMLKQLFAFIKLLNSDTGTNQIAAGITTGLFWGFSPLLSLQGLALLVIVFFFRIQIGAALIFALLFSLIAWIIDPVAHELGAWALEVPKLQPVYTELYNMPLVPMTRFNNTVVMGSFFIALFLSPLVFALSRIFVLKYRELVLERFKNSKAFKALKASSLYNLYLKYSELY